ncbi:MAG: hypothetical protein R2878_10185 [Thermoleophilia bacterium]
MSADRFDPGPPYAGESHLEDGPFTYSPHTDAAELSPAELDPEIADDRPRTGAASHLARRVTATLLAVALGVGAGAAVVEAQRGPVATNATASSPGTPYRTLVESSLQQLTGSAIRITGAMARTTTPRALPALNRMAVRQIVVVEQARVRAAAIEVTEQQNAAHRLLLSAAAEHRTFLEYLAAASGRGEGTDRLERINQARSAAGAAMAAYREFFAIAPGVPNRLLANNLANVTRPTDAIRWAEGLPPLARPRRS